MLGFLDNHGDRIAVHFQNGALSYEQMNRLLGRAMEELDALGLSAGDRLATILPNSLELLICYYACLLKGVLMVPVNSRLTVPEADSILERAQPQRLITTESMRRKRDAADAFDPGGVAIWEGIHRWLDDDKPCAFPTVPDWDAERPAILFYTSGSTGKPKGAIYTWRTLRETCRLYREVFSITAKDRSVICHCFSHNFMFSQFTVPFLDAGGTVHIVDFGSAEQAAGALLAGATFICLIPWLGYQLLEHFREHTPRDLSLRACLVGADRVPRDFFSEFEELMGVIPAEILGMTETNVYAVNRLIEGDLRLGSVGQAFPDSEIQIRDVQGRAVEAGASAEIWVRTPMAMAGYWQDPEQTRAAMRNGWIATGDAGYLDADGFLWFTGRLKHLIICDGDNVYPKEVENAIGQHPAVNQVCVVGLPHETRGETVGAAVTLKDSHGLALEELETFLEDKLAETKIPTKLLVLDQLPQTSNGKLDREAVASSLYRAQSP